MKEKCDFPSFTAHVLQEDLIHIKVKKIAKLTAGDIRDLHNCIETLGKGAKVYNLLTFNHGYIPFSRDAMAESKKQGAKQLQAASAYVINNTALRLGVNFFMNFYKPRFPIFVTKSKADGIAWLKAQKLKGSE